MQGANCLLKEDQQKYAVFFSRCQKLPMFSAPAYSHMISDIGEVTFEFLDWNVRG
jgi:hypothetical protein